MTAICWYNKKLRDAAIANAKVSNHQEQSALYAASLTLWEVEYKDELAQEREEEKALQAATREALLEISRVAREEKRAKKDDVVKDGYVVLAIVEPESIHAPDVVSAVIRTARLEGEDVMIRAEKHFPMMQGGKIKAAIVLLTQDRVTPSSLFIPASEWLDRYFRYWEQV